MSARVNESRRSPRARRAAFLVPGGVVRESGGNVYDRAAIAELRARGWDVTIVDRDAPDDVDVVVLDSLALRFGPPRVDVPVVALAHQLPSEAAGEASWADEETRAVRAAAAVVAVAEWLAVRVRELGAMRVDVIRPGRDRAWAPGGPRGDASWVLCVANAFPGKGLPEAVAAFDRADVADATLRIAGDPERDRDEGARLRRAVAGSHATVDLAGSLTSSALSSSYADALCLLSASRYEGWPIAVSEAMASGLPVVGFDVPGISELVRDGRDGILVRAGDVDALGAALERVLRDASLRTRLGASARTRALGWPTWAETAGRFADVLEEVASQATGAV